MDQAQKEKFLADQQARLASSDRAVRLQAAEWLLQQQVPAAGIAPLALKSLESADEILMETLVGWLEESGMPAEEDVGSLIPLLDSGSDDAVYWTITLLGRLGPFAAPTVPKLIQLLDERWPLSNRERAAWALGKIGPAAAAAKPKLDTLAAGKLPRLARLAAEALREIGM